MGSAREKACAPAAGVSEIFSLEAVEYFQNRTRRTKFNQATKQWHAI
jgi:hypothetical protein